VDVRIDLDGKLDVGGMFILLIRLRSFVFFALLWVFWFNFGSGEQALCTQKKTVLVLYGSQSSLPGVRMAEGSLTEALSTAHEWDLEVYSEYLDFTRFPPAQYGEDIVSYLRSRYETRKPDLLITVSNTALRFVLDHRDKLFSGVPIVFACVDYREVEGRTMPPDVTGLWMAWDYQRTLEMALRLQPKTREVICVAGTGVEEQSKHEEARKALERFAGRVRARWLDNLPLQMVLDEVARLPLDSVVLYIPMLRDGIGQSVSPPEVARQLAAASSVPVYGLTRTQLGQGIIGGALVDFSEIGSKTAALALRVLAGERLPLNTAPYPDISPLFINWQALKKWHVSENGIPKEATVLYRDPSLWEQHPRLIIGTAATLVLQALLIVGLIVHRSRSRRAENALRESEARFRMMADTAPVMVWMSGIDMLCTFFNKPWIKFTGRTVEQELGNGWSQGVHPEDLPRCLETYVSNFKARRPFAMEYRLRNASGQYRWILDNGVPRYTEWGFAGYIGSCLDITDRKQAELQLQQQRDELAHLNRVTTLGEMATALAHELNQPLGAVHSNAEAAEILLGKDPPDLGELGVILGDIRQDAWRAGEVIHRMRTLLKRHRFKMELIEVKDLVEALGGLLQALMISQKTRLRIEVAQALPPVWGDSVELQQVLLNLILNALDAMTGCPIEEREVLIRALANVDGGVKISVIDQGTGFPEEKLERIFEPFFTTKKQGLGIGLSICQTIIEAHGGRLTAENNCGRGATVHFTLPARPYS
jgi:PAS domain S-box-containing protein